MAFASRGADPQLRPVPWSPSAPPGTIAAGAGVHVIGNDAELAATTRKQPNSEIKTVTPLLDRRARPKPRAKRPVDNPDHAADLERVRLSDGGQPFALCARIASI